MSAMPKMADIKALKNLVPLNGLSNTHFEELARKATVLEIKQGKFLFKKGERDNSTCYVLSGEIALHDGSDIKLTIQGGTEEAKHPIAPQQPRQLSARAKTKSTVISIDSGLLDVMLAWEQSSAYEVAEIEADEEEDWMTRMMQSDLMQRLPATNLQQLFIRMKEIPAKAGETIVSQDEDGDYYYIIKQGKCVVSRKPSATSRPIKLAELNDGDSFGEESLLSGSKRNATVTMMTDGSLMRLAKVDFDELLKSPLLSKLVYDDAKKLVEKGAVYLDVRLPGEYVNANLNGSVNIPLAAIRNEITEIDRSKTYIVYCDTGRRSTSAVFLLGQFGIDAHVLANGLSSVPLDEYANQGEVKSEAKAESAEVIDINRDKEQAQNDSEALAKAKKEKEKFEAEVGVLTSEVAELKAHVKTAEKTLIEKNNEIKSLIDSTKENKQQSEELEKEMLASQQLEVDLTKVQVELDKSKGALTEKESELINAKNAEEQAQKKIISQGKELVLLAQQKESIEKTVEQLKQSQEGLQREKEALSKDSNGSLKELNAELEKLRSSLEVSQNQNNVLEADLSSERGQIVTLRQEVEQVKTKEQLLNKEISEQKEVYEKDFEKKESLLNEEKNELVTKIELLEKDLANESTQGQSSLQKLQQEIDDLKGVRQQLESEIGTRGAKIEELEANLEQLNSKISLSARELQDKTDAIETEKNTYKKQIEELSAQMEEERQKSVSLTEELNKAHEENNSNATEIQSKMNVAITDLKEKEELLVSVQAKLDDVVVEKENAEKLSNELSAQVKVLNNTQLAASNESSLQISELQRQMGEVSSERHSLNEKVTSLKEELRILNDTKTALESSKESDGQEMQDLLNDLRRQIEDQEELAKQARQQANEKEKIGEELRTELVALRAVYAQKEDDVTSLKQEVDGLKTEINSYSEKDSAASKNIAGTESALKELQQEYEQVSNESNKKIEQLEKSIEEKQKLIDEASQNVERELSLRTDAESSFSVMENEITQHKSDAESLKSKLEESQLTITTLESELGKLKQAQQDWRTKENDAAKDVELEFNKSRLEELEQELKDSQSGMAEAREHVEKLEKKLSMERHMADTDNNLQGQIEKLKNEMETQLSEYKSEVDSETVDLRNENEKLQKQLGQLHKDHEQVISTGKASEKKQEQQPPKRSHGQSEDHSALFDLPDMDKNLFNSRVNHAPAKSNMLLTIVIAVLFSVVSAGGVYWYFVINNKAPEKQASNAVPASDASQVSASANSVKAALVKKATKATPKKPLFNLDKAKKPRKKKVVDNLLRPTRVYSDFLKSGGSGPVMSAVPAGTFKMGSPSSSVNFEERPQHPVAVKKFSISKYEVSFAEYDRFAAATGRPRPSDNGWGRQKRPVVNVSWLDANAYTKWLSKETGHTYRLPTEAEWEYAARAGTQTKYWWGAKLIKKKANCFNCGSQWDRISTAPVGRFEASSLGLHDMSANAMEWVMDCYHKNFDGAPADGSAWGAGKCDAHVARGGSYRSTADNIRITKRSKFAPDTALDQLGFRVVRTR